MQRRHDPTFYWATSRLPREVRPAVHALYGFVRGADELVDGPTRPAESGERRRALDLWQAELEQGLRSGRSEHPVIAALVDAGRRHELPLEQLSVYMDAMRVDCGPVRLDTRADLNRYMRGSAESVGLIMAPLLGVPRELHWQLARLAVAFQLTNFIRDVREDFLMDRVYLPAEDRDHFGVSVQDIAAGRSTAGLRSMLAVEVGLARSLFASSADLPQLLTPSVRPGMRAAQAVYVRVLDRIEALGFDVLCSRVSLPPWQAGGVMLASMLR